MSVELRLPLTGLANSISRDAVVERQLARRAPGHKGCKPGSWYARNTRAPGAGGLGEAPDDYDFEPLSFRRLYKIAPSESMVDYVYNSQR
jgi:hypothetical protein